jgi:hypothetical protein
MDLGGRALLRKAQTAARSSFFHFHSFMKVNFQHNCKRKKPVEFDWLFLVAGEPQISNFIEGYEMVVELWLFMNRDRD